METGSNGFTLDSLDTASGISSDADAAPFLSLGSGNSGSDSGSGSDERFDPSIHVDPGKRNADGSYRRKRGRKAGSSSGSKRQANNSASVETLSRILAIVHLGIASASKTPELNLDQGEADSLAMATANVLEQFDIRPDPRIEAIVGLVTTAGIVYGPKIYLIRERKKEEREVV